MQIGVQPIEINNYLHWFSSVDSLNPKQALKAFAAQKGQLLAPDYNINDGFTNKEYWMVFTLHNTKSRSANLFLLLNNPYLNVVEYYFVKGETIENVAKTGIRTNFHTRPYTYHDFVLPIDLLPDETKTILIKSSKKHEIYSVKPVLLDEATFNQKEQKLYLFCGFFLGLMVLNLLVNVFLSITLNFKVHLAYCVYVAFTILWMISSVGLDFQLFYPNVPQLVAISQPIFGCLACVFLMHLAMYFLEIKKYFPRVYKALNTYKIALLLQLPFWVVAEFWFTDILWLKEVLNSINVSGVGILNICVIWMTIIRARQGFKPAWLFILANIYLTFSIISVIFTILYNHDVTILVTPFNNLQIGIVIETIIIFGAIIYQYNLYKQETEEMHQTLLNYRIESIQNIVLAQERERERLAQDLHDDLGATLSSLLLHISNIPENHNWGQDVAIAHHEKSIDIGKKALRDLRNISHNLIPKDFTQNGLFQVLKSKIADLNAQQSVTMWLNTDGNDTMLSETIAVTIYRIINELINNALKHSNAQFINIDLSVTDTLLTLIVEDDGHNQQEMDNSSGIGLRNILSRVKYISGIINIDKNKKGWTVIIEVPLKIDKALSNNNTLK